MSDASGAFILETNAENIHLRITYVGCAEKLVAATTEKGNRIQLNVISLAPLAVGLEEVLVKANMKTSSQKIDRLSYRANDFQTAEGGSATDLLSKLPSVSVDPDGTSMLKGRVVSSISSLKKLVLKG